MSKAGGFKSVTLTQCQLLSEEAPLVILIQLYELMDIAYLKIVFYIFTFFRQSKAMRETGQEDREGVGRATEVPFYPTSNTEVLLQ